MNFKKMLGNKALRIIMLLLGDIIIVNTATFLSIILRFGLVFSEAPAEVVESFRLLAPLYTVVSLMIFGVLKLYRSLWEYASIAEMLYVCIACFFSITANYLLGLITQHTMPRGVYVINFLLLLAMILISRLSYRMLRIMRAELKAAGLGKKKRVMIIGAGAAGNMLLRDYMLAKGKNASQVICLIDDDKNKIGSYINGIKVVGGRSNIEKCAQKHRIDEIIYAIPSADLATRSSILSLCKKTTCQLKTIPSMGQILSGKVKISQVRNIEIEDLLGREPIHMECGNIFSYVKNKTILVTGGGGSIGSELCRQIALHRPDRLIIFDIYENNAYNIQNELIRKYGNTLDLVVLIGSVRDSVRVNQVFDKYRPDLVFHAAAHKHVPLMEDSPNEAIKNNVFGTVNVSTASIRYGAERFVLISTDKAVNPTNIMGATKRMCEMVVQSANNQSKTDFVAVRFGNVLGSNGSVIPLFKQQIEAGGPVTVTDPGIIRYFMTIPEAVSLILQAAAHAKGGEIFVLDMGDPVKILDLAENLIRLSGHIPYVDIDIQFTGLRPGEKLYEELLMEEEGLQNTDNNLIHIGRPIDFDQEWFKESLTLLHKKMCDDSCDIRAIVQKIVPTYRPGSKEDMPAMMVKSAEPIMQPEKIGVK